MILRRGCYDQRDCILEWLNIRDEFLVLEKSALLHWQSLHSLTDTVDAAERGELPKFVAMEILTRHNDDHGTRVTYDEVVGRYSQDFVFSPEGEWVLYTDKPGFEYLIHEPPTEVEPLVSGLPPTCRWLIFWFPAEMQFVVYRSPYVAYRSFYNPQGADDQIHAAGLTRGPFPTYVLPPEIEGSISQEMDDMFQE